MEKRLLDGTEAIADYDGDALTMAIVGLDGGGRSYVQVTHAVHK